MSYPNLQLENILQSSSKGFVVLKKPLEIAERKEAEARNNLKASMSILVDLIDKLEKRKS